MFYRVCFDIVDNRIRYRVVKILKKFGMRVQKSVFECPNLTEEQYLKMKHKIESFIDAAEDSVRYYCLSKNCVWRTEYSGIGEAPHVEKYQVI